ncbi:hypothetical protein KKC04_04845, partial [Patescibacteria group bacterium]|nr:hypothetical protein [Patescibacteria group bacterium]
EPSTGSIRLISQISGTALDNWGNNEVKVAIRQLDAPPLWFDGSSFQLTQSATYWISVNSNGYLSPDATSWIYAPSGLDSKFTPGSSGLKYLLLSKAEDIAGNAQQNFNIDISSIIVNIDRKAPTSSITFPLDNSDGLSGRYQSSNVGKSATSSRLKGSVSDSFYTQNNAGVESGKIRVSYLETGDTYYWTGSNFSSYTVTEITAWQGVNITENEPNWDWVYLPDMLWDGDREYKLETKFMDKSRTADNPLSEGNWETAPFVTHKFIVDDSPPSVEITSPTSVAHNSIPTIYGDANGDIAGFNSARIRISTGTAVKKYWEGDTNEWVTAAETWNKTDKLGSTSWYYAVEGAMLEDDTIYTVSAKTLDYAGNYSILYSTYAFTYDITEPSVALNFPKNGKTYSQIFISTPVLGTSASNQSSPNTGVSTVTIAVSKVDGDENYTNCFDGSSFIACVAPIWLPINGGTVADWTFNDNDIAFINDSRYKFEAKSADFAKNNSSISGVIVKYDIEKPTSTITAPNGEYVNSLTQISGTASDDTDGALSYEAGLGTYTVKVAIRRLSGSAGWWDEGTSDFSSGSPKWYEANNSTVTSPNEFSYGLSAAIQTNMTDPSRQNYQYRIVTWAYDLAQNREFGPNTGQPDNADIPASVGRTINFDNAIPVAITTAPANNSYKNDIPALYGITTDTGVVTTVQLMIKADAFSSVWKGTYNGDSTDWDDSDLYTHWSTATYSNGEWNIPLPNIDYVNNNR